jgi:hypothetical protein
MLNFCTLFDSNYLSRGLALYESLCASCPAFHLYVFAFDDNSYNFLVQKNYRHITPVSLKEFEDDELLKIKPSRTAAEYCWTCTPSTILYCIKRYNLSSCTYLDADMFFYNDPSVLIEEMGNKPVLISEHRYTKLYDQSARSGIYCVQFMCFKNTEQGMRVLQWWRNACLDWCYAYYEDGKFGDQKYLDNWPAIFEGVHVMQHEGGGLAPWNLQQYNFAIHGKDRFAINKKTKKKFPVIFIHYHGLQFYTNGYVTLCPPLYEINEYEKMNFFIPYVLKLREISIALNGVGFDPNGARGHAPSAFRLALKYYRNFAGYLRRDISALFRLKNYNFKKHLHLIKPETR